MPIIKVIGINKRDFLRLPDSSNGWQPFRPNRMLTHSQNEASKAATSLASECSALCRVSIHRMKESKTVLLNHANGDQCPVWDRSKRCIDLSKILLGDIHKMLWHGGMSKIFEH